MKIETLVTVLANTTVPFTYFHVGDKFCFSSAYTAYREKQSHFYEYCVLTKISEESYLTQSGTIIYIGVCKNDRFFHPVIVEFTDSGIKEPRPYDVVMGGK